MLNNDKFILVQGDDWEGLYLNNEMFDEDHKILREALVGYMNKYKTLDVEFHSLNDEGDAWLQERGNLPNYYNEIPENYFVYTF
ncbi:hypothetical protein BC351_00965 [Paenibacillus ferrarius]|uniref:Uncharacterized protein n=1 Tax=Paenibacillus ferrarius TaxID=1469647 RepID=A0A1V4HTK8_9BACL|nr:hypothetical protein [Paenibacillus ferrarius]OPH61843.1 hypothetical protein BC351_00965 [Paenibacillus ferrarius]